jgi:hypothetical protein
MIRMKIIIRNLFILILTLGLTFTSLAQVGFVIDFIDEQKVFDTIFMAEAYFTKDYKSAILEQGEISRNNSNYFFKGTIAYPTAFRVWGEKGSLQFNELIFVDTGVQSFRITTVNHKIVLQSIVQSKAQTEYRQLLKFLKMNKYEDDFELIKLNQYLLKNMDSYVVLYMMAEKVFNKGITDMWRSIAVNFGLEIKNTKAFQFFAKVYLTKLKIEPVTLINATGSRITKLFKPINLNKKLVVLFWFAGCKPCISEMEFLNKRYPFKKFEIVSICTDSFSLKSAANKFMRKNKIKWVNYWDHKGNQFSKYIQLDTYPTNIVIDAQKNIVGKHLNRSDFL